MVEAFYHKIFIFEGIFKILLSCQSDKFPVYTEFKTNKKKEPARVDVCDRVDFFGFFQNLTCRGCSDQQQAAVGHRKEK